MSGGKAGGLSTDRRLSNSRQRTSRIIAVARRRGAIDVRSIVPNTTCPTYVSDGGRRWIRRGCEALRPGPPASWTGCRASSSPVRWSSPGLRAVWLTPASSRYRRGGANNTPPTLCATRQPRRCVVAPSPETRDARPGRRRNTCRAPSPGTARRRCSAGRATRSGPEAGLGGDTYYIQTSLVSLYKLRG